MAQIRSIYTDKRKTADRSRQAYMSGTAVRKLQPVEVPAKRRRQGVRQRSGVHRAHREKMRYFSIGYTIFLTVASVLTLFVCAGYLQLQANNTALMKNIASLEQQLTDLKTENDDEYNRVTASVDLEKIRDIAIHELGMVYANADQVVLYDNTGSDYVKQYADIPEQGKSLKDW
ncbi:MAG: cell division protein FtsL [Lachnospiraceae bacterium]|nr:cell division protein FtsL [Lachnospiraceae bacterium]